MLMAMGFAEKKCITALKNCDLDVERATDWIFSHMDDPDEDEAVEDSAMDDDSVADLNGEYKCGKPGVYKLQSFITHLGASVHAGHYVCHIKK
jgi:ubiquitin carboxyl-terminal hydrolase 5/13